MRYFNLNVVHSAIQVCHSIVRIAVWSTDHQDYEQTQENVRLIKLQ